MSMKCDHRNLDTWTPGQISARPEGGRITNVIRSACLVIIILFPHVRDGSLGDGHPQDLEYEAEPVDVHDAQADEQDVQRPVEGEAEAQDGGADEQGAVDDEKGEVVEAQPDP